MRCLDRKLYVCVVKFATEKSPYEQQMRMFDIEQINQCRLGYRHCFRDFYSCLLLVIFQEKWTVVSGNHLMWNNVVKAGRFNFN